MTLEQALAMDLTPSFHPRVRPSRAGVYLREDVPGRWVFSSWDGASWHMNCVTTQWAAEERLNSFLQDLPWRGLARCPA